MSGWAQRWSAPPGGAAADGPIDGLDPSLAADLDRRLDDLGELDPSRRPALRWAHLGQLLREEGRSTDAVAACSEAVARAPHDAEIWAAYATALDREGRLRAAGTAFRKAATLRPGDARFLAAWGTTWVREGRFVEAIDPLLQAVHLDPANLEALRNLAFSLRNLGRVDDAIALNRRAVELAPRDPEVCWNLAISLLLAGRWEEGWAWYEARLSLPDANRAAIPPLPRWDGVPDADLDLVVYAEQGLGDVIQFVRFLPIARARVRTLHFLGPRVLEPLLGQHPGIDHYHIRATDLPAHKCIALLSLPAALGLSRPDTAPPAALPKPSAERLTRWAPEVRALGPFVVGLVHQGNPAYAADAARSIALHRFAPLWRSPELTVLNLQKGHGEEQHLALAAHDRPHRWTDGIDVDAPFLDTAAILLHLDAFVTTDTAAAHLAGSLGVPTHLLLPFVPDWRWGLTGDSHPYYPSIRLHRQQKPGRWDDIIDTVRHELLRQRARLHPPEHP